MPATMPDWLAAARVAVDPSASWDELVGCGAAKSALRSLAARIEAASDPASPARAAAAASLPRGVILFGKPGTGKTLSVRLLAAQLERSALVGRAPGVGVSLHQLSAMTVRRWAELGEYLAGRAPDRWLLLLADEISESSRRTPGTTPERPETLLASLRVLDGVERRGHERVVFVAATTAHPTGIDQALLRSGRFDLRCHLDLPTPDERAELLRRAVGPLAAPGTSWDRIARILGHETPASCMLVGREAIGLGIEADPASPVVGDAVLLEAAMRLGNVAEPRVVDPRRTACHEAAHALCAVLATGEDGGAISLPVSAIVLHHPSDRRAAGRTDLDLPDTLTVNQAKALIRVALAGAVGEELLLGGPGEASLGSSADLGTATRIASELAASGLLPGYPPIIFRSEYDPSFFECAGRLAAQAREEARLLLTENLDRLRGLAARIEAAGSVTADELAAIMAEAA
jgi:cell division protease FtsH